MRDGFARCPCGAVTPGDELPVDVRCGFCGAQFLMGEMPRYRITEEGDVEYLTDDERDEALRDLDPPSGGEEEKDRTGEIRCGTCGAVLYSEHKGFSPHPRIVKLVVTGVLEVGNPADPQHCPQCSRGENMPEKKSTKERCQDAAIDLAEVADTATAIADAATKALSCVESAAQEKKSDGEMVKDLISAKKCIAALFSALKKCKDHPDERLQKLSVDGMKTVRNVFDQVNEILKDLG